MSAITGTIDEVRRMSPGRYLRLRREAADLSIQDVARMLTPAGFGRDRIEAQIEMIEMDSPSPIPLISVTELRDVFAFDIDVYHALVTHAADPEAETPLPQICLMCACTWTDPCHDHTRGTCGWATTDLCSHCVGTAAMGAAILAGPGGSGDAA